MTVIDAHQHYWNPTRADYGWLRPGSPLYRSFLPDDLATSLADAAVGTTVLVQAAPTLAETDWLLDLAGRTPTVAGVVGWVDLDRPDVAALLAERIPRGLVGIRPMLQDLPDPDWILARSAGLRAVSDAGLGFDALVRPAGLAPIAALAERHPGLRIVVDHAGKPPIGTASMDDWWSAIRQVAARPNCVCKLSGLMTEAPPCTPRDTVVALVRRVADLWGPDRLIWGSDWPVLTLAGDYREWLGLARDALADWDEKETAKVFGGNATRIYRL